MYLTLFLFIAAFFSLSLGEFGQFPFGRTTFSVSATDILLILNLAVVLIWNIGIKKNLEIPKNFFLLALFWAIAFFSLLINFNFSGWLYLIRFIIYSSTFYLSFHLVKSGILGKDEFFKLLKLTCLIILTLGLGQFIIFPDLSFLTIYGYDPHKNRIFSTFLDPNFTGNFLNFGLLVSIYEMSLKSFKGLKQFFNENKFNLVFAVFSAVCIILTYSRSAYLMLFSSLFLLLIIKKKLLLIPLFLTPLILYLIFPPFAQRIEGGFLVDESASERFYSWEKGLTIFQQNPFFGVGFNNIREAGEKLNLNKTFSPDGGNSGAGIDSSLIFIMASTGIIGLLSFSAFAGKILYEFSKRIIQRKAGIHNLLLPLFAGLIINSFFINSLFYPQVLFLWSSILGLFYGLGEGEGS